MKNNEVPQMWICQMNKPDNKAFLKEVAERKDSSCEELVRYYKEIIRRLINTPAWGVNGVNKMVNELRGSVIAKLTNAKKGKTTAWAHAKKLLNRISDYGEQDAAPCYRVKCNLIPPLTDEELLELLLKVDEPV